MKKLFVLLLSVYVFSSSLFAQEGTFKISVGIEAGIPTAKFADNYNAGFGGSVKALFGVGETGQFTLSSGYTVFKEKGSTSNFKSTASVIPLLVGYRHNFNHFYLEPQLGLGIVGARLKAGGNTASDSETKFTWAGGLGYIHDGFDFSVRYQSSEFENGSVSFAAIKVAYNFSLGHK